MKYIDGLFKKVENSGDAGEESRSLRQPKYKEKKIM